MIKNNKRYLKKVISVASVAVIAAIPFSASAQAKNIIVKPYIYNSSCGISSDTNISNIIDYIKNNFSNIQCIIPPTGDLDGCGNNSCTDNNCVENNPIIPEHQNPGTNNGENGPDNNTEVDNVSEYEKKVVELVNKYRTENGVKPLTLNKELSNVARIKSQDMKDKGYFSHTSPTYGSPFDMLKSFGISYRTAGENIAMGQKTPEMVVEGWMNSEGHRANILNSAYTQIGVGYVADGNYWTQLFIG